MDWLAWPFLLIPIHQPNVKEVSLKSVQSLRVDQLKQMLCLAAFGWTPTRKKGVNTLSPSLIYPVVGGPATRLDAKGHSSVGYLALIDISSGSLRSKTSKSYLVHLPF